MILSRVSPVTHSIGNCVKRVVVIVASVLVFQNPVTRQNALGALRRAVLRRAVLRYAARGMLRCASLSAVLGLP